MTKLTVRIKRVINVLHRKGSNLLLLLRLIPKKHTKKHLPRRAANRLPQPMPYRLRILTTISRSEFYILEFCKK